MIKLDSRGRYFLRSEAGDSEELTTSGAVRLTNERGDNDEENLETDRYVRKPSDTPLFCCR